MTADKFCLLASGLFFMTGLLTGVWKFLSIMRSPEAVAPAYVDITHRASLMYSFSCLVLREFVPYSPVAARETLWVVAVPILFFASAVLTYIVHGFLKDTDNQLRRPHKLGSATLSGALIWLYMISLIVGEIGGFAILLVGAFRG